MQHPGLYPPALTADFGLMARLATMAGRIGILSRRFFGWDYIEDTQSVQTVNWGSVYSDGDPGLQLNMTLVKPYNYVLFYCETDMSGNFPQVAIASNIWGGASITASFEPSNGVAWNTYGTRAPRDLNSQAPNGAVWIIPVAGPLDAYFKWRMASNASSGTASFRNRRLYATVL